MDVWISIKGVQKAEGESNTLELNTAGRMERTANGYKLIYKESTATGMEGVTTTLSVDPSAITLERQGTMNSLLVMEKGRRTMCNYDTGYGSLMMGIYASDIHTDMADQGGEFDFHYTLDINSGYTSAHDVYVKVRETAAPDYPN